MIAYVQAITERKERVEKYLAPTLAEYCDGVRVFVDSKRRGILWNAARIWRELAKSGEVGLTLPDDAIPHPQLGEHLEDLAEPVRSQRISLVSLFLDDSRGSALLDWSWGHNFTEGCPYPSLVGAIISPGFAHRLYDEWEARAVELDRRLIRDEMVDDAFVGKVCREDGIKFWNSLPSMVQHDAEVESTMSHAPIVTKVWAGEVRSGWFRPARVSTRTEQPA